MHDEIEQLIREHGELGVNALAKAMNKPLSTTQKWLEGQTYFVKTRSRKWDLPERLIANTENTAGIKHVKEVIAEVDSVRSQLDTIALRMGLINSYVDALQAIKETSARVAGSSHLDKELIAFSKKVKDMQAIVNQHMSSIPEQYRELLKNLHYMKLTLYKGSEFIQDIVLSELTSLITKEKTELEESTIELLTAFQRTRKVSQPESQEPESQETVSDSEIEPQNS